MPQSIQHIPKGNKGPIGPRHIGKPFRDEFLARPRQFSCESGTNGANVSTSSGGPWSLSDGQSGFDDFVGSTGSGTTAFDNTHVYTGNLAVKVLSPNGTSQTPHASWTMLGNPPAQPVFGRLYIYLPAAPTQLFQLVSLRDSSGTNIGGIRLAATPTLQPLKGNTLTGTVSGTLPLNQWIRIEWRCVPQIASSKGEMEIRAWWTNPASTGATDYTSSATNINMNGTGAIDEYYYGVALTGANFTADMNMWMDNMVGNYYDWPGPVPLLTQTLSISLNSGNTFAAQNTTQKTVPVNANSTFTAVKQTLKTILLNANSTLTVIFPSASKTLSIALNAGSSFVAQNVVSKTIALTSGSTFTAVNQIAKTISVNANSTLSTVKQVSKSAFALTSNSTFSAVIQGVKLLSVALNANSALTLTKKVSKTVGVNANSTFTGVRQTARTVALNAGSSLTASFTRTHTLLIALAAGSSFALTKTVSTTKALTQGTALTATNTLVKLLSFALTAGSSLVTQRTSNKTIPLSQGSTLAVSKKAIKVVTLNQNTTLTLGPRQITRLIQLVEQPSFAKLNMIEKGITLQQATGLTQTSKLVTVPPSNLLITIDGRVVIILSPGVCIVL